MEVEIFKNKLYQGLNMAEALTRTTSTLPVLNNVLLTAEKSFLKLSATNLESSIIWWILAKTKKEGRVCLKAGFLKSLLDFVKEEKITLKTDNNNLILEEEDQITQIQGVNPDDFPIIPKIDKRDFIEIDGKKLNKGIEQVVGIPSFSQVRPEISGIYFSFKKDKVKIAGTDSFRLAEKNVDMAQKVKKDFSFILPQQAARILSNILSLRPEKIRVFFTGNQVLFEWLGEETDYPNINFSSRLIEGEYPDYQEIIPRKYTTEITIKKEVFQNQIKKAGLFAGKISEVKIAVLPDKGKINISSQNPDLGKSQTLIPVKIEGKTAMENSFNYRFLLDGLNNIKSAEITFGLSDKEGPAAVRPLGDESYVYVLMPIKSS